MLRPNSSLRQGTIVALVALLLTVILGITAFALEGGYLIEMRRKTQAVADAAALAAAADLYEKYSTNAGTPTGTARTSATDTASANGFANDAAGDPGAAGTSKVEVRDNGTSPNTYKGGPNAGTVIPSGYVEVTVTKYLPRYFSSIWGSSVLPVTARAVARGKHSVFNNGVICLSPTDSPALKSNGNGAINVKDGDIIVNSSASGAAVTTGGATITVTGTGFTSYITGTATGGGFTPTPTTGVPPTPDPLAYLPEPAIPGTNGTMTATTTGKGKGGTTTTTMTPGYFASGVTIGTNDGDVIMEAGLYYFAQGFDMSGQGTCTGTGVTIFNAGTGSSQGIKIAGQGTMNISPPTAGVYQGVTIFQARASSAPVSITGNGSSNVSGTIYAAGADAKIEGNGDVSVSGQVIAYTATVGGNGTTNIDFNAPSAPGERIIQLVE